jgi:integrase
VLGDVEVTEVRRQDVERIVERMVARGLSPKTIGACIGHLTVVFDLAIDYGWTDYNPARRASRPRDPHDPPVIRVLSLDEVHAVISAIPNAVHLPRRSRNGRCNVGPCLDRWADHFPPVLRVVVRAAALTGMRQSELLGLRWRDVDWHAQRVREHTPYVRRGPTHGKSRLSVNRSIPMPDLLADELRTLQSASAWSLPDQLTFAHPRLGTPLDGAKVTRKFQDACRAAGVQVVRFHDLRHGYATQPRRRRRSAPHHPGIHGPRRPLHHPDLRPLHPRRTRDRPRQPSTGMPPRRRPPLRKESDPMRAGHGQPTTGCRSGLPAATADNDDNNRAGAR